MRTDDTARKYPLRMPPDWEPPVPAWSSEFDTEQTQLAMVVVGCQFKVKQRAVALEVVRTFVGLMDSDGGADHVDLAECDKDSAGLCQIVATGYWFDGDALAAFMSAPSFAGPWVEHSQSGLPYGVFREVFNIPMERHETLHSGPDHTVGVSSVRKGLSDPVLEHAYWGSMRDRLPASASDPFIPDGSIDVLEEDAHRIVVRNNQNLAIIRSGQDLSAATGKERDEYFTDVEPNLVAGMKFLRDEGAEVHCYDCRFMRFLTEDGEGQDHTYGFAYFRSLADLESWSEHHPTHLAIFNAFMEFAPSYGPDMRMRLWHEVSVLPAANQFAEYVNCAPNTGLLSGVM